jgi:hypothetical protein
MSPIRDDDRQRLDALNELVAYLDAHPVLGVVWHYGKVPPLGTLALQVSADNATDQLAVLPMWFRGPNRNDFVAIPIRGAVAFQVFRSGDVSEGARRGLEKLTLGAASDVLAAIIRWKDAASDETGAVVPPIGVEEVTRLRVLVEAAAAPHDVVLEFDPLSPPVALPTPEREALAADVANISPPRLAFHLPRDEKGRLELGATALLTSYDSDEALGGKRAWLAALAPARRRDGQELRIALRPIARSPYAHTWDAARWLWDRRAEPAPEAERWGVAGLDVGALGLDGRATRLVDLERRGGNGASDAERVALCILLQDEGRLEEAFALFGISLSAEVTRLIHGSLIPGYIPNLPAWTAFLRRELRTAAPWLMPAVLMAEVSRRATLRSRPKGPPRFRLCALPHQTSVAKVSVMLVARNIDGTEPGLQIENTGWDFRLPEPSWKRPLELDLRRFGLIAPG